MMDMMNITLPTPELVFRLIHSVEYGHLTSREYRLLLNKYDFCRVRCGLKERFSPICPPNLGDRIYEGRDNVSGIIIQSTHFPHHPPVLYHVDDDNGEEVVTDYTHLLKYSFS